MEQDSQGPAAGQRQISRKLVIGIGAVLVIVVAAGVLVVWLALQSDESDEDNVIGEFETSAGTLEVFKVEIADRYPEGCDPGDGSCHAFNGDMLWLWMKPQDSDVDVFELYNALGDMGVAIEAPDGSRLGGISTAAWADPRQLAEVYSIRGIDPQAIENLKLVIDDTQVIELPTPKER